MTEKLSQAERMKAAGKQQVLLWLSTDAKQRLERLAVARATTQVSIVETALLALETAQPDLYEGASPAPDTSGFHDLADELWSRVDRLEHRIEAVSRPGADLDVLVARLNSVHASLSTDITDLRTSLAQMKLRLLALENGGAKPALNADSGDNSPEPLPCPSLGCKGRLCACGGSS